MKKFIVAGLMSVCLSSFADEKDTIAFPAEAYSGNASSHVVPLPKSGVSIVPLEKMDIPESFKKQAQKNLADLKNKGYIETEDGYAATLLQFKTYAKHEIETYKNSSNPYDSHLKGSLEEVLLAFPFKFTVDIKKENILGFAPAGGYVTDKENAENYLHGGWTAIGIYFIDPTIGTCVYTLYNLKISKGAMQRNQETTVYIVNKKPSSTLVEGKPNSGFVYTVNWDDPEIHHSLECATKTLDKALLPKVIDLANEIDSHVKVN